MNREWITPLSILAGSVIVALGLYFGLRAAPQPREPAPQETARRADAPARSRPESPFADRERRRVFDDEMPEDEPTEAAAEAAQPPPIAASRPGPAGTPAAETREPTRVEQASAEAFESVRSEVRECWNSLPDDPEAPSSVALDLSLSYDAEGNLIASGVSENREARRDGLAQCLGPIVHGLRIPAPGSNTSVQVRVTVP